MMTSRPLASNFTTALKATLMDDGRSWRLDEPFEYHVGSYPSEDVVSVPAGFVFDGASVPRLFQRLFPKYGLYTKATAVHDYLCHIKDRSSDEVHRIFCEAMQVLCVPYWQRIPMCAAVRWFGPKFEGFS